MMAKKLVLLGCAYMGAAIMFTIWASGVSWITITIHSAIFTTVPRDTLEGLVWVSFAASVVVTKIMLLVATSDVYKDIKSKLKMEAPPPPRGRY